MLLKHHTKFAANPDASNVIIYLCLLLSKSNLILHFTTRN